jgi:hypothetical protein
MVRDAHRLEVDLGDGRVRGEDVRPGPRRVDGKARLIPLHPVAQSEPHALENDVPEAPARVDDCEPDRRGAPGRGGMRAGE